MKLCYGGRVTLLLVKYMLQRETYSTILDRQVQDSTSYKETLLYRDTEIWKNAMNQ